MRKSKLLASSQGSITLNFLFAFVLVMGFASLLFSLSLTLTVVEITQYITFASARNFFASHVLEASQREQAFAKYLELRNDPVFAPLYSNGWFEIMESPTIGNMKSIRPEVGTDAPDYLYYGTGTEFIARMLDFHIPFFGSTATEGDGTGSGFKAFVSSYLGREPSVNECINYVQKRWDFIKSLDQKYSKGFYPSGVSYVIIADNGC